MVQKHTTAKILLNCHVIFIVAKSQNSCFCKLLVNLSKPQFSYERIKHAFLQGAKELNKPGTQFHTFFRTVFNGSAVEYDSM